jgi:ligand-binding sensor domain-containing protein
LAEPEAYRIPKHLAFLEDSLRKNPPPQLSQEQSEQRSGHLNHLRDYWMRGVFPINRDFKDSLVPHFVDVEGIPCAVGYLLLTSGQADLVEKVVDTQNYAYIRDIQDPLFDSWLLTSGLTREECAKIQPSYGGEYYHSIVDMVIDQSDRIWVLGLDDGPCYGCSVLANWMENQWRIDSKGRFYQSLAFPSGEPAIGMKYGLLWQNQSVFDSVNFRSLIRDSSDESLWAGTDQGLRHISLPLDSNPRLLGIHTPENSLLDIKRIAMTQGYIWAATESGLAAWSRTNQVWTQWDAAQLQVSRVMDVVGSSGDTAWFGVDGPTPPGFEPREFFSSQGLWMIHRGQIKRFRRDNSPLPSDTLLGVLPGPGKKLWVVASGAIYQFTPPATINKMADFPEARVGTVMRMVMNQEDQLFVGTVNGVYQLSGNAMRFLIYPTVNLGPRSAEAVRKRQRATLKPMEMPIYLGRRLGQ